MRLDAHQHFWDYTHNAAQYPWITDDLAVLRRDFAPDDLAPLLARVGFDGSIAVQAREVPAETEYLLGLAERHAFIRGVVGWLDLTDPRVAPALIRAAARPKLRGLRMAIHDRADPDFADSEPHRRGVARLERLGLTYDLLLRPPQIAAATRLVDHLPKQRFVVDHIAKPPIAAGGVEPWRTQLAALAERPNVVCKLSGLVSEADWKQWTPADITPYLDRVLEMFGPGRLMIGSDWPVCTVAASYERTMRVVLDWAARLSAAESEAVLGGTCARFYGLAG